VCGCPLTSPSSPAAKETSSSGLGIHRIPRINSANSRKKITPELLTKHLGELFQDTSRWPSTRDIKGRTRKPPGNLWVGSRSPTQNLKLLLQLLHRRLERASRSSDRKGTLIFNILFYCLSINPHASMQSASRYPFGLTCKEPST
jgi:hypothetical protein